MNAQVFRYVLEVARQGSISQAARTLFLSQSSLSRAISGAEEELNIQIFDRSQTPLRLTSEGETFLHYARQLDSAYRQLYDGMQQQRRSQAAQLRLGISAQTHVSQLAQALYLFRQNHPEVTLFLQEFTANSHLFSALDRREIDVGLFNHAGAQDPPLRHLLPIARIRFFLAVPDGFDPFPHRPDGAPVTPDELGSLTGIPLLALSSGGAHMEYCATLCRQGGLKPPAFFRYRSLINLQTMLAAGQGFTVLISLAAQGFPPAPPGVRLYSYQEPQHHRVLAGYLQDNAAGAVRELAVSLQKLYAAELPDSLSRDLVVSPDLR